jgi:hypothetical protein
MHPRLLVAATLGAALALPAAPSVAQHIAPHSVGMGIANAKMADGAVRHRHPGRRDLDGAAFAWGYDLQSSYDDRDWAPRSGNGWWHDRPDRAYPRWVQEQRGQACAPERMWWSGSGWHC